jgi:nicotinate-nucleotide adenylyltransferase
VNKAARVGVYGGTFDPIHRTHLEIAQAAMRHAALDQVIFVVAARPPHKRGEVFASAEDRLAMVEALVSVEPGMAASRMELDREGPSYTVDTLRDLQAAHPGAALYLIVGYDTLIDLPKWRDPQGVLERARLLVVPRPDAPEPVPAVLDGHFEFIPFPESTVSSTEIRERLAAGESVADCVPAPVVALIQERGLYAHR